MRKSPTTLDDYIKTLSWSMRVRVRLWRWRFRSGSSLRFRAEQLIVLWWDLKNWIIGKFR